jgi:outer membrane protein
MSVMKRIVMLVAVAMLTAGSAWAQTPPAGQPPQTPPAQEQQKPAPPPAPAAQPPAPFPEGAKVGWVDIQIIAQNSAEGKAATIKIQDFNKKKSAEIGEKTKALQALQKKLQDSGTLMNDAARGQLEKDVDKATRDLQFFQQEAQAEQQTLTNELQNEFKNKLQPIIDAVAKEKGLHMVFSIRDSGAIWAQPGLDLSAEVVKRFDASRTAPAKK